MAELLAPAIDPTHRGGPTLVMASTVLDVLPPVPPIDPDPGDPDAPAPTPASIAPAYHLWAVIDGARVVEFTTVDVESYVVAALGPATEYRHRISVAGSDPAWRLLGAPTGVDGLPCFAEVLDRIRWELWCDGLLVAEGRTDGEVQAGASVDLSIAGGGAVWRDRYLGDGGVADLLGGLGSFPSTGLNGWSIDGGVETAWNTTDPFDGARSLRVRGQGWIRSPYGAWTAGGTATNVQITSTLMARLSDEPGALEGLLVRTDVYDSVGALRAGDWAERHAQSTDPDIVDEWQAVDAPGLLPRESANFRARTSIWVASAEWIDFDRVRQVQRGMTGSLSPIALETLAQRVVARAQTESCGGPLGVTVEVHTPTGASDAMRWEHADDPSVADALSSVCDRSDGPDGWFTPDRVLHLTKRAGSDRNDLVLNRDTVVTARLVSDPSLRFLEFRARVGSGGGPTRQVVGWDRRETGVVPRRAHQLAPTELSFRSAESWGAGFAEVLARRHQSVEVEVPESYGRRFGIGDRVPVALAVEGLSIVGRLRVVQVEAFPRRATFGITATTDEEV